MVKKTLKLVSVFLSLYLVLSAISGCSKDEKPNSAASPTPDTNNSVPTPVVKNASNASGLTFQKSLFVKKGADGKIIPVEDGVFKKGDDITLVLLKTGKFKKGSDGKNWLDMDMRVKTPKGTVLSSKQSLLGDKGKVALKDDETDPNGTVNTNAKVQPGVYQMTLIVYDKIAGTQISETKSFTLK